MARSPLPRFVVSAHDGARQRRRRLWWGLAWLGSLLLTAVVVGTLARRSTPVATHHRQQKALLAQIDDLKQQVANLQRSAQVTDVATRSLRGTLTQREQEINGLRADLGFYSRLVGDSAQRQGLKVQEVRMQPVAGTDGSNGWDFTLSLIQNVKRDKDIAGTTTLSVDGLLNGKVVQLDWAALGDASQKDGLPFRFRYFQQLHGTIVLPPHFQPTRLRVRMQPADGSVVTRTIAWKDALNGHITTTQGEHDA